MSRDAPGGTVIVVAHDAMDAARVEVALHELAGWRIEVCAPRQLRGRLDERPEAVVALVLSDAETQRLLRAMGAWPRSPAIVALCDDPGRLWTSASRTLGLRAALPLRATAEELAGAVRAVHAGLFVLHPEALVPALAGDTAVASGTPLTSREREILELMADGANNRMIASRLAISRHTVKFHVASILAKLGAASRTEAVALALRSGLLAV
ncbi:MAG TPA: response regulator transcription factor [Patescibacteria group bacterium]|nr:response regulator transcription factor [Patescibacteria group bacterium]